MVKRGEIWKVNWIDSAETAVGRTGLGVIVSPSELNDHLQTVLVAPMNSMAAPAPFRTPVFFEGVRGQIMLDQLQTVEKTRLIERQSTVSAKTLSAMLQTVVEMFKI
jgi:mRNA interferase MazF